MIPKDTKIPIVYVKDVVGATSMAYEKIKDLKTRIYNLVNLIPGSSAKDIADMVKKYVPNAKITFKPDPDTTEIIRSWAQRPSYCRSAKRSRVEAQIQLLRCSCRRLCK